MLQNASVYGYLVCAKRIPISNRFSMEGTCKSTNHDWRYIAITLIDHVQNVLSSCFRHRWSQEYASSYAGTFILTRTICPPRDIGAVPVAGIIAEFENRSGVWGQTAPTRVWAAPTALRLGLVLSPEREGGGDLPHAVGAPR